MPRTAHSLRCSQQLGKRIAALAVGDRTGNAALVALIVLGLDAAELPIADVLGDARQALARELDPQLHAALAALVFGRRASKEQLRYGGDASEAEMQQISSSDAPSARLQRHEPDASPVHPARDDEASAQPNRTNGNGTGRRQLGDVGIAL
jgi:hypothetical protein